MKFHPERLKEVILGTAAIAAHFLFLALVIAPVFWLVFRYRAYIPEGADAVIAVGWSVGAVLLLMAVKYVFGLDDEE